MEDKKSLEDKIDDLSNKLEKSKIFEYVNLLETPSKLLVINFWIGIIRGLGMAIGFTILGAALIYILQKVVLWNLPVISDLISEIIRMVKEQL